MADYSSSTLSVILLAYFLSAAHSQTANRPTVAPQREPYPLIVQSLDKDHTTLSCPGGVINVVFAYWDGTTKTDDTSTSPDSKCGAVVTSRIRSQCQGVTTGSCAIPWNTTPVSGRAANRDAGFITFCQGLGISLFNCNFLDGLTPGTNDFWDLCMAVLSSPNSCAQLNAYKPTPAGAPAGFTPFFGFDACKGFDKELTVYYNCAFSGLAYSRLALPDY